MATRRGWTRGRKITAWVVGVFAALVVLGLIVGPPPEEPSPEPAAAPTSVIPEPAPPAPEVVPTPAPAPPPEVAQPEPPAAAAPMHTPRPRATPQQKLDFLNLVRVIAPPLAEFPERVIGRGENSCTSFEKVEGTDQEPWENNEIVDEAIFRFSGGSYTVSRAEAVDLVQAAADTVCADR